MTRRLAGAYSRPLLVAVLLHASCIWPGTGNLRPGPGNLGYGTIRQAQLIGEHGCHACYGSLQHVTFTWSFSEHEFEIKAMRVIGPLEPVLDGVFEPLLGKHSGEVELIKGKWELRDGILTLSQVRAQTHQGQVRGMRESRHEYVQFETQKTAPTLIRFFLGHEEFARCMLQR